MKNFTNRDLVTVNTCINVDIVLFLHAADKKHKT